MALLAAAGCQPASQEAAESAAKAGPGPAWTYQEERDQLWRILDEAQLRLQDTVANRDAGPAQVLFNGWLRYARLTGDLTAYRQAGTALDALRERLSRPPCEAAAEWALAVHRPGLAEGELAGCPDTTAAGLRADIAWYQGRYDEALALARHALNARPTPDRFARLARYRMALGSPREAMALLEAAERRYHNDNAHQLAWFKLQRGLNALHSGDFERARALYRQALQALPGWWLAQEHLAEVLVQLGETEAARGLYEEAIATTGKAEFLAARAELDRAAGRHDAAQSALARAREELAQRLEQLPEAVAGHAVAFFIDHGPTAEALKLARADYARRPYGEAAELVAAAELATGRPERAVAALQAHLERGWNTAEVHHLLARAHFALGDTPAGERHRKQALALNPRIAALAGPFKAP